MKPFLVEGIGAFLKCLSKLNLFQHFLKIFPKLDKQTRGALTEVWILLNFLTSIILLLILSNNLSCFIRIIISFYIFFRIFEVIVFQIYTQVYGGYPGKESPRLYYTLLSYRRSIFIALILYFEAIIWFAVLYCVNKGFFFYSGISLSNPLKALYYSFITMTTIGYGDIYPNSLWGYAFVIVQSFTAVIMIVLIIARIISYLPTPSTLDEIEKKPALPDESNYEANSDIPLK
jgi:hypothetical protein